MPNTKHWSTHTVGTWRKPGELEFENVVVVVVVVVMVVPWWG